MTHLELNNIRILSTTYEKLLIVVSEEQATMLATHNIECKQLVSEEHGISYSLAVKCASDKMCDLYKTIKRVDLAKGLYDMVGTPTRWEYGGKSGLRLDAYFIRRIEAVPVANPMLQRLLRK